MKAEFINPFIESVSELFENMLECSVEVGSAGLASPRPGPPDVIGIIGLSGTAKGSVAVRFPVTTALAVVGKMVCEDFKAVDSSIIDGVGEIVNMIAGNAKAKLDNHALSVSLPTVIRGDICRMTSLQNVVWLELPFSSSLGDFSVAINIQPSPVADREAIHESAVS